MLVVSGGDRSEMLEYVEAVLDQIAIVVEEGDQDLLCLAAGHGLDVGPCAAVGENLAHRIAAPWVLISSDSGISTIRL
jgi:hypothetical protein